MSRIAICNVSSFGNLCPEIIDELELKVGKVSRFQFSSEITTKDLVNSLNGFEYIILGTHPTLDDYFFRNVQGLKLVARHGLGYNNIDIDAAKENGVRVTTISKEIERDAVAEQAMTLLHSVTKNIVLANEMVHTKNWKTERQRLMGLQITNKVTGIIGYGNIGRRVGQIMKYGYGNELIYYDPYVEGSTETLEELFSKSDFIFLHTLLTDQTKGMVNQNLLTYAKENLVLINCARGQLVDEHAIAKAIQEKRIFGYGADATIHEPIEPDNPLLPLQRVTLSPHVGVYTIECTVAMNKKVVQDILAIHLGKEPVNALV